MNSFRRIIALRTSLIAVFSTALILSGCIGPAQQIKDVQDDFNQVSQSLFKASDPNTLTAEQERAYRQIIQKIEKEQLKSVKRDDLKVVAYAIDAFSKWRIKDYADAKATAEKGLDIYARANLKSNPREYGMLLITGGLVDYSETFWDYQKWLGNHPNAFLPKNEAAELDDRIGAAIKKIDGVNRPEKGLKSDTPIVVYANQQQLRAITTILDIWGQIRNFDDQKDPVCRWTAQANALVQDRFPSAADYPGKAQTVDLVQKISAVGQSYQCGG
jgi:hypothetical protein